jgi:flagellar hook protein FlgE
MIQALYSSVSGIQAQQTSMDVIGNDLANINTTAYKNQDVQFSDLISQQLSGSTAPSSTLGGTNGIAIGLGVRVGATTTDESQGTLNATSNPSDLAIQGNGYFMTSNGSATNYTRDGSFELDGAGNVVSSDTGQKLLGWTANADGVVDTTTALTPASTLNIPIGSLDAAQATTDAAVTGNLNSASTTAQSGTVTTSVYDALGDAHDVTFVYTPNPTVSTLPTGATSSWNWTAYSGDSAAGTPIGSSSTTGNSPMYFNASGQAVSGLAAGASNTITLPAVGAGAATPISVDMSGMTELSAATSLDVSSQNGYPAGSLSSYTIGTDGTIMGTFTNGLTKTLGQVALASFSNPSGLTSQGSNVYVPSANSGSPVVGTADSSSLGSINSGYLEQSNVDLSSSLTNLIITQRGFEANTKMVTTVDTMLQDVIEMKH